MSRFAGPYVVTALATATVIGGLLGHFFGVGACLVSFPLGFILGAVGARMDYRRAESREYPW